MGNLIAFVRNKTRLETPQGKVSTFIWLLLVIFWLIHFIFTSVKLGDEKSSSFRVWIKFVPEELFPQFAICPATFLEKTAHFSSGPNCFIEDRQTHKRTPIYPVSMTKNIHTCQVFNTKADVYVGNNSVACDWQVTSPKTPGIFYDSYVVYTQAGDPMFVDCDDVTCPTGPHWVRTPPHSFTFVGIETTSFADDDDMGYKKIKNEKEFRNDDDDELKLPMRAYRAYGQTMHGGGGPRAGHNNTGIDTRWQSQDIWGYQHYAFFNFWGFVSYVGGCAFLMVMLHNLIFTIVNIVVFGDVGQSQ